MIGLLLIYFIGKRYYELAEDHGKSKWGFAILGVVFYYLGAFVGGILVAIGMELWGSGSVDTMDDMVLGFIALPFGILSCVGFYFLLKKLWSNKASFDENIIDEIGTE